MPISVRGLARTVRTPLVTAIARSAGVLNLELVSRNCGRTDGSGRNESAEESCELHDERVMKKLLYIEMRCFDWSRLRGRLWLSRSNEFLEETWRYLYLFEAKVRSSSQFSYLRANQDIDYSFSWRDCIASPLYGCHAPACKSTEKDKVEVRRFVEMNAVSFVEACLITNSPSYLSIFVDWQPTDATASARIRVSLRNGVSSTGL